MPTAILGDRGCGKTTFVGLLWDAANSYSTFDEELKNKFLIHSRPTITSIMADLYSTLKLGSFPEATAHKSRIEFLMGFKREIASRLPSYIHKKEWVNPYNVLKFVLFDIAGEDIIDLVQRVDGVVSEDVPEEVKELLESRIIVIMIDGSKITTDIRSQKYADMVKYDGQMAILISLVSEYNSKKDNPDERKIYPIFLITKFDAINNKVFESLSISPNYPIIKKKSDMVSRKKYSEKFLNQYFRQTLAQIKGSNLVNVSFQDAVYFFSWIHLEYNDQGQPITKMKGNELDYSYEEYVEFIKYFRQVAQEMPDDVKEREEVVVDK